MGHNHVLMNFSTTSYRFLMNRSYAFHLYEVGMHRFHAAPGRLTFTQAGYTNRKRSRKGSGMSIDLLAHLFPSARTRDRALLQACWRYGYRCREIAAYRGVHEATVRRHLKQAESRQV